MAVQIYSDNPDEVTGATLNDGETGGTWTKAGQLLGVTGGPDGGLAVLVAEMPTAGTTRAASTEPYQPCELGQPDVRVLPEGQVRLSSPGFLHPN